MKEGGAIAPGARIAGLLGGDFECLIGEASSEKVADYMHWASWLNKGPAVSRLPDRLAKHCRSVPMGAGRKRLVYRASAPAGLIARGGMMQRIEGAGRVSVAKADMDKGFSLCKTVAARGVEILVIR